MKILSQIVGVTLLAILAGLGFALIVSLPVWLLWNWLMPELFGLKTITWIQALGLLMLCGMLFRSSGSSSKESK